MSPKQKWPSSNFLLPAGYLPKPSPVSVFNYYEDLRTGKYFKTSPLASGFEYYFMVNQSPSLVNNSVLKGKIAGVHGPWTQMNRSPKLQWRVLGRVVFRPEVDNDLLSSAYKTLEFTKAVGGKYTIFHTVDLEPNNPESFLKTINEKAKELGINIYLEIDGRDPKLPKWYYDHLSLWKKFKHPIVFDPATVEVNKMDIIKSWNELVSESKGKINDIVGHLHLNEYQPELDMDQGKMHSPNYGNLISLIGSSGYNGYFTFEIGPAQNTTEKIFAGIYVFSTLLGINKKIPGLENKYWSKLNNNFYESIQFTNSYLS